MITYETIKIYLGRDFLPSEIILQDDGNGVYIRDWNCSDKDKPEEDQLEEIYNSNIRNIWLDSNVRPVRDKLLSDSDFVVIRHRDQLDSIADGLLSETTLTTDQYKQILEYRLALRNLTDTIQISEVPDFPSKPFNF